MAKEIESAFLLREKKGKVLHSVDFAKIYSRDIFQPKKKREINLLCALTAELHYWVFSHNSFKV